MKASSPAAPNVPVSVEIYAGVGRRFDPGARGISLVEAWLPIIILMSLECKTDSISLVLTQLLLA